MEQDFTKSIAENVVLITVDLNVYTLTSVLKTAYWFTGRHYLHIQHAAPQTLEVRIKAKQGASSDTVAGEFMNDLLDQALREKVSSSTEPLRNLIVAHALSKTCLIAPEMEAAEIEEDPAWISIPDDVKA